MQVDIGRVRDDQRIGRRRDGEISRRRRRGGGTSIHPSIHPSIRPTGQQSPQRRGDMYARLQCTARIHRRTHPPPQRAGQGGAGGVTSSAPLNSLSARLPVVSSLPQQQVPPPACSPNRTETQLDGAGPREPSAQSPPASRRKAIDACGLTPSSRETAAPIAGRLENVAHATAHSADSAGRGPAVPCSPAAAGVAIGRWPWPGGMECPRA